jgi:hypothetical protein
MFQTYLKNKWKHIGSVMDGAHLHSMPLSGTSMQESLFDSGPSHELEAIRFFCSPSQFLMCEMSKLQLSMRCRLLRISTMAATLILTEPVRGFGTDSTIGICQVYLRTQAERCRLAALVSFYLRITLASSYFNHGCSLLGTESSRGFFGLRPGTYIKMESRGISARWWKVHASTHYGAG